MQTLHKQTTESVSIEIHIFTGSSANSFYLTYRLGL